MKKWVCPVCGYVYEGENPPEKCPQCGVDGSKFTEQKTEMTWAAEHVVGVAKDVPEEIKEGLRANFNGECSEVGMYLCMARIAHREGYPEIGLYWEKAAYEEAEHAAKFAEILGGTLEPNMTASTKKNLAWRVDCEFGAKNGTSSREGETSASMASKISLILRSGVGTETYSDRMRFTNAERFVPSRCASASTSRTTSSESVRLYRFFFIMHLLTGVFLAVPYHSTAKTFVNRFI